MDALRVISDLVPRLEPIAGEATFGRLGFDADEFHYLYLIKPNYRFPIDNCHGRALIAHVDQLFQCRLIGAHIFFDELDALLR